MIIERNSRESFALDLLRFPLTALVVLLHTVYKQGLRLYVGKAPLCGLILEL